MTLFFNSAKCTNFEVSGFLLKSRSFNLVLA